MEEYDVESILEMYEDDYVPESRPMMAGGGQLVQPSVDGSRPGYAGKMKWTKKEIQEIYKDLPENVYVSKRTLPSGKTDYNYRAKIRYKGKLYTFPSKVATPENKKQLIKDVEAKWDELAPNRISREEYAKLRLLPENRRLTGDEFAEKLNKVYKKVTYRGEKWNRQNVFNYDLEAPRSKKRIADDLGFFEKRTVKEAKDIINKYSGGKHFLKNKNLTDAQITTRAAEYVAMEKRAAKEGGKSWPRGRQNKRKVWTDIYKSYTQGGRFELVNKKELADKDGTINWKKGSTYDNKKNPFEPSNANWRKAKFRDKKSGAIFTYDNLEEMVDKHGGGYQKAIKAYNDNAILNQTTFNGKSLNEIIREAMIKKDYEVLVGKKVKANDPGLLKYMGDKKPSYSFTEAHHFKGVKNYPFETEPSFRRANREQGIAQGVYDKAVASGNSERIKKAKNVYINKMNEISDKYGGIRFKMDDKTFVGKAGTTESIVKAGLQETNLSSKTINNLLLELAGKVTNKCIPDQAEGGRIGFQSGRNYCLNVGKQALEKGLKTGFPKNQQVLAEGILKAGRSLKDIASLRGLFGPLALGFTVLGEAGFIGYDMLSKGKSFKEAMGGNLLNYLAGDKTKVDLDKEIIKRLRSIPGAPSKGFREFTEEDIGKMQAFKSALMEISDLNEQFGKLDTIQKNREALEMSPEDSAFSKGAFQLDKEEDLVRQNIQDFYRSGGQQRLESVDYGEGAKQLLRGNLLAEQDQLYDAGIGKFYQAPKGDEKRIKRLNEIRYQLDKLQNPPQYDEFGEFFMSRPPSEQSYLMGLGYSEGGIATLKNKKKTNTQKIASVYNNPGFKYWAVPPKKGPASKGLKVPPKQVKKV